MIKFEKVSRFSDVDLLLPTRATADSAGYDFTVAENTLVRPYEFYLGKIQDKIFTQDKDFDYYGFLKPFTLEEMSNLTKELKAQLTLVSTGMKCCLEPGTYLEISLRSSIPLKNWLILANGVGIIDSDYYNNPSNEGEIFFQIINFSPFAIQLKRGDRIGQGIIKTYKTADNDIASGTRIGGFGST